MPKRFLFSLIPIPLYFILTIYGCGGGSSSSSSEITTTVSPQTISGHVVDGPVEASIVSIYDTEAWAFPEDCGPSGSACTSLPTTADGFFQIDLPSSLSVSAVSVVTKGGQDFVSGIDFTNLPMSAPLSLFRKNPDNIVISPLTSIFSSCLNTVDDLPIALNDINTLFPIITEEVLMAPIKPDSDSHRLALFLSALALEVGSSGDPQGPYFTIGRSLLTERLFDGQGNILKTGLSAFGLTSIQNDYLIDLYNKLFQAEANISDIFRREYLYRKLCEVLYFALAPTTVALDDPIFIENAYTLCDAILQAVTSHGGKVLIGGPIPERLVSYALATYPLLSPNTFGESPEIFKTRFIHPGDSEVLLTSDPKFAQLASIGTQYAVEAPLFALPEDTNSNRIDYYLHSDLSHLYNASTLLQNLQDDEISDPIMLQIVRQTADYGYFSEARSIIETQIFQPHYKGDAFRQLAEAYISHGLYQAALSELESAYTFYRGVIESKTIDNASSDDIERLQYLSVSYCKIGEVGMAYDILSLLEEAFAEIDNPDVGDFGRVIMATQNVIDYHLEDGQAASAAPLVDAMYSYALRAPPNRIISEGTTYSFYQGRIYYLVSTAQRYLDLGNYAKVHEIYNIIEDIRDADGLQNLTGDMTWAFISNLVPILYKAGWNNEAEVLATSIPDSYTRYDGRTVSLSFYQARSYKFIAADEACRTGMAEAMAIIDNHIPLATDKIEALTYYRTNPDVPFVAQSLINNGQWEAAREAIGAASTLISSLSATTDSAIFTNKISLGHLKTAYLYTEIGDSAAALSELFLAKSYISNISLSAYRVDALVSLARTYALIGDDESAQRFLYEASSAATALIPTLSATKAFNTLSVVILAAFELAEDSIALDLTSYCRIIAAGVFDDSISYEGNDHDDLAEDEVDYLIDSAKFFIKGNDYASAWETLLQAVATAEQIFSDTLRMEKFVHDDDSNIIHGLAMAEKFDHALEIANSLPYSYDRSQAYGIVAESYVKRDSFPETSVADIDTDHDGMPNFFNPLASVEEVLLSGLTLDPDSDNDSVPDALDRRPLFSDSSE